MDGDTPIIENSKLVSVIADLLSTKAELVEKALLFRTVATGRDVIDKQHTEQEATYGRDAFAKVSPVPFLCTGVGSSPRHISAAFARGLRCSRCSKERWCPREALLSELHIFQCSVPGGFLGGSISTGLAVHPEDFSLNLQAPEFWRGLWHLPIPAFPAGIQLPCPAVPGTPKEGMGSKLGWHLQMCHTGRNFL